MITRRDLAVAAVAVFLTLSLVTLASSSAPVLGSTIFDWESVPVQQTKYGALRSIFKGKTATIEELEMHVTTLNPGQTAHAPHQHPHEELLIIKEGTVEALINGEWKKAGPGSVIFFASNQLHGVRNPGPGNATYHVIGLKTAATT